VCFAGMLSLDLSSLRLAWAQVSGALRDTHVSRMARQMDEFKLLIRPMLSLSDYKVFPLPDDKQCHELVISGEGGSASPSLYITDIDTALPATHSIYIAYLTGRGLYMTETPEQVCSWGL
jgi:hypothetical protein